MQMYVTLIQRFFSAQERMIGSAHGRESSPLFRDKGGCLDDTAALAALFKRYANEASCRVRVVIGIQVIGP